jgi:uncharacterized membrane protein
VTETAPDTPPASVAENIDKVIRFEQEALEARSRGDTIVDAIGGFVGTLAFVSVQVVLVGVWVAVNALKMPAILAFDPFPFPLLAAILSFEGVLIAAFVLMKQNRISNIVTRRDHLDLQVNLRTERQATQIIQMLNRLSAHVGFEHDHDADGHELSRHVEIEHLVDELHRRLPNSPGG